MLFWNEGACESGLCGARAFGPPACERRGGSAWLALRRLLAHFPPGALHPSPSPSQTSSLAEAICSQAYERVLSSSTCGSCSSLSLPGLPSPALAPFTGSFKADCKTAGLREAFPDLLL